METRTRAKLGEVLTVTVDPDVPARWGLSRLSIWRARCFWFSGDENKNIKGCKMSGDDDAAFRPASVPSSIDRDEVQSQLTISTTKRSLRLSSLCRHRLWILMRLEGVRWKKSWMWEESRPSMRLRRLICRFTKYRWQKRWCFDEQSYKFQKRERWQRGEEREREKDKDRKIGE